jgi:hypothetical protein
MKYRTMLCTGHPRSGTHYVAALMSVNFMKDEDYLKIYRNHELPDLVQDPDTAYIYVWRGFEGTARSIYVLKERFGLNVESYEAFLANRYSEMWGPENPDDVLTNVKTLNEGGRIKGISDFFEKVEMTPREFWEYYNGLWEECAKKNPNVVTVQYDELKAAFEPVMASVAARLGSELASFKDIDRKVGWWK